MCFCLFVLAPPAFFELEKSELRWRSLSESSALGGIGTTFQAGEPQGILRNQLECGAATIL